MSITKEFVTSVRRRIAENPVVLISQLAVDLHASEANVIMALPRAMRLRADKSQFTAIWENVSRWKNMAVDLTGACEMQELFPVTDAASTGGATRLHECLPNAQQLEERLGGIWFVSRPLFAGNSYSVRFFDRIGDHIVSIYTGRDISGAPDQAAKASYDELRERFGLVPTPPIRCNGRCGYAHPHGCRHDHAGGYAALQSAEEARSAVNAEWSVAN